MDRVYQAWSPEHSEIVLSRPGDLGLVARAFESAIVSDLEDATALFNRHLGLQICSDTNELAFRTDDAPVVIGALLSFAREVSSDTTRSRVPLVGNWLEYRCRQRTIRRAISLVGAIAVAAPYQYPSL